MRSDSTDIESAVLGAHALQPMDGYGQQLYEAGVHGIRRCTSRGAFGPTWPETRTVRGSTSSCGSRWGEIGPSDIATIDERDVAYRLTGLELSGLQKFEFSRCLQRALDRTRFPAPPDGTPRVIQHLITVDFGAFDDQIEALFASVELKPASARQSSLER